MVQFTGQGINDPTPHYAIGQTGMCCTCPPMNEPFGLVIVEAKTRRSAEHCIFPLGRNARTHRPQMSTACVTKCASVEASTEAWLQGDCCQAMQGQALSNVGIDRIE